MAMSVDFTSNEFAEPLRWIRRKREKGVEWIDLETRPSESPLHTFLEKKRKRRLLAAYGYFHMERIGQFSKGERKEYH
jgi:hypothetical protein